MTTGMTTGWEAAPSKYQHCKRAFAHCLSLLLVANTGISEPLGPINFSLLWDKSDLAAALLIQSSTLRKFSQPPMSIYPFLPTSRNTHPSLGFHLPSPTHRSSQFQRSRPCVHDNGVQSNQEFDAIAHLSRPNYTLVYSISTEVGLEGDVEFTYRGFEAKTLGSICLPSSQLCDFATRKDCYFSLDFDNGCKSWNAEISCQFKDGTAKIGHIALEDHLLLNGALACFSNVLVQRMIFALCGERASNYCRSARMTAKWSSLSTGFEKGGRCSTWLVRRRKHTKSCFSQPDAPNTHSRHRTRVLSIRWSIE